MKRFFAIFASVLVAASLASCNTAKENEIVKEKEPVMPEVSEKVENDDDDKIVLDIKELGAVDEMTLEETATALGFENEKLFHAVANALGKEPFEMTREDLDKIHYVAVGPEGDLGHTVYVGYIDYVDACFSEDENIMQKLNELVMVSEFSYDKENDTLADLGNFKNIEMFEIYDVAIDDISFIREYESLIFGYFKNNGITDVSCLADYNPESLVELDLTGNDISDWTPLHHIKEKVTVFYGESDGMPIILTLDDMLKQKENPVDVVTPSETENEQESDEADMADDSEMPALVDENGEAVDFGALFE